MLQCGRASRSEVATRSRRGGSNTDRDNARGSGSRGSPMHHDERYAPPSRASCLAGLKFDCRSPCHTSCSIFLRDKLRAIPNAMRRIIVPFAGHFPPRITRCRVLSAGSDRRAVGRATTCDCRTAAARAREEEPRLSVNHHSIAGRWDERASSPAAQCMCASLEQVKVGAVDDVAGCGGKRARFPCRDALRKQRERAG